MFSNWWLEELYRSKWYKIIIIIVSQKIKSAHLFISFTRSCNNIFFSENTFLLFCHILQKFKTPRFGQFICFFCTIFQCLQPKLWPSKYLQNFFLSSVEYKASILKSFLLKTTSLNTLWFRGDHSHGEHDNSSYDNPYGFWKFKMDFSHFFLLQWILHLSEHCTWLQIAGITSWIWMIYWFFFCLHLSYFHFLTFFIYIFFGWVAVNHDGDTWYQLL